MAIADDGELVVLAPGVERFGEDPGIDALIRQHGYAGTSRILLEIGEEPWRSPLQENLGAAAHLIHGSTEGRFTVTYCPGRLTKDEVESVGYRFADLAEMSKRYDPGRLTDGWNTMPDGERVFYISNPGLGLWAARDRFPQAKDRP